MRLLTFLAVLAVAGAVARAAPATRPSGEAAARAATLAANAKTFQLHLSYHGDQDKPYYDLLLSVAPVPVAGANPFSPAVTITPAQGEKVIAHLAADGFLDRSADISNKKLPPPAAPCYTMLVRYDDGTDRPEFYERLGWERPLLARLDGLRAVLDGDAAKAMDLLLGRLSGHRREWEKRAATRPAADAPAGATAGTRESSKGWELYVWQHDGETYCSLLTGTNRRKSADEIDQAAVTGIDPAKTRLGLPSAMSMTWAAFASGHSTQRTRRGRVAGLRSGRCRAPQDERPDRLVAPRVVLDQPLVLGRRQRQQLGSRDVRPHPLARARLAQRVFVPRHHQRRHRDRPQHLCRVVPEHAEHPPREHRRRRTGRIAGDEVQLPPRLVP